MPEVGGVTEVLHASLTAHRYPRHCHDTWTVLLIDDGAVAYELGGRSKHATTASLTVLPPFVAHVGQTAQHGRQFHKRVLYLDDRRLTDHMVGAAVDQPALGGLRLRRSVAAFHDALDRHRDDLELESMLAEIVSTIGDHLGGTHHDDSRPGPGPAESLKAELDRTPFEPHRLGDLAARLGWTERHLIRSFTTTYGLPPHRYLISRRIDEARRQLLDAVPPGVVAANVGFCDQAHLTRHFKAHTGTTPARFARAA